MTTVAQMYSKGERVLGLEEEWAQDGWYIASRLSDRSLLLVSADMQTAYVFADSLIGAAIKPYAVAAA